MAPVPAFGKSGTARRGSREAPADGRGELAAAAEALFLERGYEATSVSDIIARAGFSKGGFYHHFAAKEDLLEAIVGRLADDMIGEARPILEDRSLDALQRLNALFAFGARWRARAGARMRYLTEALMSPANLRLSQRMQRASAERLEPTLLAIIREGVGSGQFNPPDPQLACEVCLSLADGQRRVMAGAFAALDLGDAARAAQLIEDRLGAEGRIIARVLGAPDGSVRLFEPGDPEAFVAALDARAKTLRPGQGA